MSTLIPLESIRIAAPCHADWNAMTGDSRARFCGSCEKHVYNLSGMTRSEAEDLIRAHEGELCVRFAKRADGTVVSGNCPVGLQALRQSSSRPVRWTASAMVMLLMPFAAVAGIAYAGLHAPRSAGEAGSDGYRPGGLHLKQVQPFKAMQNIPPVRALLEAVDPEPPMIMGAMVAMPAPPPTPTPAANCRRNKITPAGIDRQNRRTHEQLHPSRIHPHRLALQRRLGRHDRRFPRPFLRLVPEKRLQPFGHDASPGTGADQ